MKYFTFCESRRDENSNFFEWKVTERFFLDASVYWEMLIQTTKSDLCDLKWSAADFLQQPVILSMFSVTDKKRSVTAVGGDTGETLEMEWSSSLRKDILSTAATSALSNGTVPKPECEKYRDTLSKFAKQIT